MKNNFVQLTRNAMVKLCTGLICIILVAICTVCVCGAISAKAESAARANVTLPEIPEQHPYVFVNEEYIENLMALKDNEYFSKAYEWLSSQAKEELPDQPAGGVLSSNISRQLEAKAFMYMLGQLREADAVETVEYTIEYVKNAKSNSTDTIERYKAYGINAIQTGALVYDWCHDIMTVKQREELATYIKNLLNAPEQPCRPNDVASWSDIADKAVGYPLIYNSIAAIAIYDVYPEIYETVMPKILGSMAEIVKTYGENGALTDGSIMYTRDYYAYHVAILLERLGCDHQQYYGNQTKIGYKMLYSRTPYGAMIKQGDDFYQLDYKIGNYTYRQEIQYDLGILGTLYEDPYLKFQYIKESTNENTLLSLLLNANEVEPKLPDDLPLAFEVGEPRSEIMARTSWQDGLDSPAVTAYMNMNNRRTGDHDHSQIGEFHLYYKGPLTMSSGFYNSWGSTHYKNYYIRTISANCLTVYDPSESFAGAITAQSNDGGQKLSNWNFTLESNMSDENLVTVTEGTFIGPNEDTPAFSYMKGDLTNAYTDKVESYKRAMVFMDTFNQEYPGVMVVFDRVVSSDASYEKNWLLQAVTEPQVDGNKITIVNTEEGCNGKLVNTTLYPENVEITTVGGIGKFIADGQEWAAPEWAATYSKTMSSAYASGFRCEVAPTTAAKEDIFLNAMYVTDADGNAAELPMISEETAEFMGVTTLDRMVMFSKSGNKVSVAFNVTVRDNGYENVLCLMTDITSGKWTVSGNGVSYVVEATDKEGCLVFTAQPGTYTITPADTNAEVTEFTWEEAEKEAIGDFAMKVDSTYAYVKTPNRLVDGEPYIAIADFMERFRGAVTETNGQTLTVTLKDGRIFTFNAGSKEYTMGSGTTASSGTLKSEPFLDANGVFYMNCSGISTQLGFNAMYTAKSKVLKITLYSDAEMEGVDSSKVLWPVAITASSDDGNVPENTIDRNLGTRWSSARADGEWICYDLGEEMEISNVQIAFYNALVRNWLFDIQISLDGENFTNVLIDMQSSATTLNPETFELPEGTKARYVRYVGHGVNNSTTGKFVGYYNSLTQVIINR